MPMMYFSILIDFVNSFLQHGAVLTALLASLALLGISVLRYAKGIMHDLLTWMHRVEEQVTNLEKAWTAPNGHLIDHSACFGGVRDCLDEIRAIAKRFDKVFMEHHEDTKRIAHEDHWKNCEIERCPQLLHIHTRLSEVIRITEDLAERAEESRAETREAINIYMRRFDDFASHAIAALRRNGWD